MSKLMVWSLCILLLVAGSAFADTVSTFNSIYGTVTVNSTTKTIDLLMNPGYSLKIQDGNDFSFNCTGCSAGDFGALSLDYNGGANVVNNVDYVLASGQNIGSGIGVYDFSLTKIATSTLQGTGITSVESLHLVYTGTITFSSFALHVCGAGGTSCSPNTFFAEFTPGGQTPEPASLMLFGSGLVAVGGFFRKRIHI